MAEQQLGPWPLGIDMLSTDEETPRTAVRDAVNVDILREGWWDTRPGLERLLTQAGLHSLWCSPDGRLIAGRGAELVRVRRGSSLEIDVLATLPSADPIDYDMLNGEIVFTNRTYLGVIDAQNTVRPLTVPDGVLPVAVADATGGLPGARYSVALARLNDRGEEGALSQLKTVHVPDSGGIRLTLPAGAGLARVYRTGPNGAVLYRAADVPLSLGSFLLGNGPVGRQTETRNLRAMVPGDLVRYWMGRILVARGRLLCISVAGRYSLTSPRHLFVQFPYPIAFIEGMDGGGIYVGQAGSGVKFLQGTDPKNFVLQDTYGEPPIPRSSIRVTKAMLDPQLQAMSECAIWLATNGFVVGRNDGTISEPQAQRIQLPLSAVGRTAVLGRRVLTIVNN